MLKTRQTNKQKINTIDLKTIQNYWSLRKKTKVPSAMKMKI